MKSRAGNPVIVPGRKSPPHGAAERRGAWAAAAGLGSLFALVGGTDLVLVVIPSRLGNPDWEFGTAATFLNGLPVMTLGLGLLLVSTIALQLRRLTRFLAVVMLLAAVVVGLASFLLMTTAPMALQAAAQEPLVGLGVKKAIAKAAFQGAFYFAGFTFLGITGWRCAGRV